jgi:hypothetical protein
MITESRDTSHASERIKFTVISPSGAIQRGALRLDLGPIRRERRAVKPLERNFRKLIRAQQRALGRYLVLHDRSRRRQRSGWLVDLGSNMVKAARGKS